MKLKALVVFTISSLIFLVSVYLYVTSINYPMEDTCSEIYDFKYKYGYYPKDLTMLSKSIQPVGFLSKLEYSSSNQEFRLYFCPTILGPCSICDEDGELYFKG